MPSKTTSFVSQYFTLILFFTIVVAGIGFFVFNNKQNNVGEYGVAGNNVGNKDSLAVADDTSTVVENLESITDEDHYRGNPEAKITIIEYSDFECPFCKKLHPTLKTVVEKYPDQVSWVYRHFPLSEHKYAFIAAQASECVASIAGEDKFWEYIDSLFDNASGGLNPTKLIKIANDLDVDGSLVQNCLDSGEMKELVESKKSAGLQVGVSGTPGMVLVVNGQKQGLIPGALPLPQLEEIIGKYL